MVPNRSLNLTAFQMPGPQFATAGKSARRQITRSKRNAKSMPFAWMIGIVEFHAETFTERIDKKVGQEQPS